ncbi:MAG: chorismate mutase [Clostridiales bacterium]|nr:chorismate mutase [Clostridiales bacterium]
MEHIVAVRGATTVACDTREEIEKKTTELARELARKNGVGQAGVRCVCIHISTTQDIHSFYPARALRESGLIAAPLFSCAEPDITGALPLCIRMMLLLACDTETQAQHVYLHGASALRPDLAEKQ